MVLGAGRAGGGAGAGVSTDYKAFPSLALSFELGLGMAKQREFGGYQN